MTANILNNDLRFSLALEPQVVYALLRHLPWPLVTPNGPSITKSILEDATMVIVLDCP